MILLIIIISYSGHSSTVEIPIGDPQLCQQEASKYNKHESSDLYGYKKMGYTSYAKCIQLYK